jgi:hypothetical protein
MPGTRRVKVNRVNGEAYLAHTGLPGIIARPGPIANAVLWDRKCKRAIVRGAPNHNVKR